MSGILFIGTLHAEMQRQSALTRKDRTMASKKELLGLLVEAQELLQVAHNAMTKAGLRDRGSDIGLSHEVRMFALRFSDKGRDGPGELQVRGTGEYWNLFDAINKVCK